jgi:hypothetical protein
VRSAKRKRSALIEPRREKLVRILRAFSRDVDKPAPPVTLGTADFDWLVAHLEQVLNGEDKPRRGRRADDNHIIFVALNVALRRGPHGKVLPARKAVATDWKLSEHAVKRAEQQARTVASELLAASNLTVLARMVAWHRARYLGR